MKLVVSGSGTSAMVSTGEAAIGVGFLHTGLMYQEEGYDNIQLLAPSDGTGYEVGGTAMLGISRPVIKAHGSSDDRAVFNAIRQAMLFADSGIIDEITNNMDYMRLTQPAAAPEA